MKVFDLYSKYYDMLYYDKDYSKEVDYIVSLIQKNLPGTKTILDLGCGSGKHTILLAKKGYKIHGIDQSDTMLKEAKERLMNTPGMSANVSFSKGDIRTLEFDEEYDVITALFHVISYLNTNNDLKATFKTVHSLLKNDGIFIFDLWYGPCVLTERPKVTTKEAENEEVKIVRVCNPVMHSEKNQVDVNYQISVTCKKTGAKESEA